MPMLLQFGAGNIGRSLIGALFSAAGYEVVFVDIDARLVEALERQRGYRVVVKDVAPREIQVSGVRAIHAGDAGAVAAAVAAASVAATAVGARALEPVARLLAAGLVQRGNRPLDVILCENLNNAAATFAGYLAAALAPRRLAEFRLGLIETSIGKMAPIMPAAVREADPTVVWAEAHAHLIADANAFVNPVPEVPGLLTKGNFAAYVQRKLFVHNLGHAACAYHGFIAGARYIWEAMELPRPAAAASGTMREAGRALLLKHPAEWSPQEMEEHISDLLHRFRNRALGDTVHRVGRDLPRKLAAGDRLVGALRLQLEFGIQPQHTLRAIAAALLFRATDEKGALHPADREFAEFIDADGPLAALHHYAGFDVDGLDAGICRRILEDYHRLAPGKNIRGPGGSRQ